MKYNIKETNLMNKKLIEFCMIIIEKERMISIYQKYTIHRPYLLERYSIISQWWSTKLPDNSWDLNTWSKVKSQSFEFIFNLGMWPHLQQPGQVINKIVIIKS